MADIDTLTGDEQNDELLLTDEVTAEPGSEPLDEIEYPDTLDDEPDPAQETPLAKKLRDEIKERNRLLSEKDRELEALRNRKPVVRTPKPTMESCDYDEDKYDEKIIEWKANEAAADASERAPVDPKRTAQVQEWQNDLQAYKAKAAKLGKADFDDAETTVVSTMTEAQQSTIVMAAKDPARFIYALGRSPLRLEQLAAITNPIKLAAEVARIEGARVMARKEPANIDTPLRGGARLSTPPADEQLAKLQKEADRTGDRSKVIAYKREQKRAKAA